MNEERTILKRISKILNRLRLPTSSFVTSNVILIGINYINHNNLVIIVIITDGIHCDENISYSYMKIKLKKKISILCHIIFHSVKCIIINAFLFILISNWLFKFNLTKH